MNWVYPDTTIQLFNNIPLSPTYTDTLYFGSRGAQEAYFGDKIVKSIPANYYQRSGRNSVKIEAKIKDVINCNYMRFKNSSHSDKWFYCFIDGEPQYINENTVEVFYIIDLMQTYLVTVDYALKECFVEREHSETDVIGDNLEEEPVSIGEYVCYRAETDNGIFDNMSLLLFRGYFPFEEGDG